MSISVRETCLLFTAGTSRLELCFSVSLVKGSYPAKLLKEWDLYDKRKGSENDRPGEH